MVGTGTASWFIGKMTHPAVVGWGEGAGSAEEVTFELAIEAELHFPERCQGQKHSMYHG